jgi:hypothetical protein
MELGTWRNAALAKTEQAITEAEIRLTTYTMHVEQLRLKGHDPTFVQRALDQMYGLVQEMRGHRKTILSIGQSQFPVHWKRRSRT